MNVKRASIAGIAEEASRTGKLAHRDDRARIAAGYGRVVRSVLRIALFYKLIIANGVITIGAVIACSGILASALRRNPAGVVTGDVWLVIAIAAMAGVLVNALVVRVALLPLRDVEAAAE